MFGLHFHTKPLEKGPEIKILMMGLSGVGKSCIRSVVFSDYSALNTSRIALTENVEISHIRFLGNLLVRLWDCGGQDTYRESYCDPRKQEIFKNVHTMVYVTEVAGKEIDKEIEYYKECTANLIEFSPDAQVYCLVNKMDTIIDSQQKEEAFKVIYRRFLSADGNVKAKIYQSSVWDDSLYLSWSHIMHDVIPNIKLLEDKIITLTKAIGADEAALFEKSTLLVIFHHIEKERSKGCKLQSLSHAMKILRCQLREDETNFKTMDLKYGENKLFFQEFTRNSYIMFSTHHPLESTRRPGWESLKFEFMKYERNNGMSSMFDSELDDRIP